MSEASHRSGGTFEASVDDRRPESISLVIPTYNERENIVGVVQRCCDSMKQYDYEVIVVDDDSPDMTWKVAQQMFADNDDIRVVRRRGAAGLATAVLRGFRESSKDACAVIDADLQHPPEKLPQLFEALRNGADIAVGSRYVDGGSIENWSRFRYLVSRGATAIARGAVPSGRSVSDPMSGFFAVQRRQLQSADLEPRGYKILLEVLVKCDWEEVEEVPYVFAERDRGDSKLTPTEYVEFAEHALVLAIDSRGADRIIEPQRATRMVEFAAVGGLGAGINMLVFLIAYSVFRIEYLLAGTLAFLLAVHWNFLGNWLVTFDHPDGDILSQYVTFHAVSIGGFLFYAATLSVGIDVLGLSAIVSNALALGTSATFNFLGSENVAFASSAPSLSAILPTTADSKLRDAVNDAAGSEETVSLEGLDSESDVSRSRVEERSGRSFAVERYDRKEDVLEGNDE